MVAVEDTVLKPATAMQIPGTKPTLYEYFFNMQTKRWNAWEWIVPEYVHDREKKMNEILVPTVDTLHTAHLLALMNSVIWWPFHQTKINL